MKLLKHVSSINFSFYELVKWFENNDDSDIINIEIYFKQKIEIQISQFAKLISILNELEKKSKNNFRPTKWLSMLVKCIILVKIFEVIKDQSTTKNHVLKMKMLANELQLSTKTIRRWLKCGRFILKFPFLFINDSKKFPNQKLLYLFQKYYYSLSLNIKYLQMPYRFQNNCELDLFLNEFEFLNTNHYSNTYISRNLSHVLNIHPTLKFLLEFNTDLNFISESEYPEYRNLFNLISIHNNNNNRSQNHNQNQNQNQNNNQNQNQNHHQNNNNNQNQSQNHNHHHYRNQNHNHFNHDKFKNKKIIEYQSFTFETKEKKIGSKNNGQNNGENNDIDNYDHAYNTKSETEFKSDKRITKNRINDNRFNYLANRIHSFSENEIVFQRKRNFESDKDIC